MTAELKEQIAKAMIERFKSVVAEAAGEPFEQTKVGLPGVQIWEGYTAAALSAIEAAGYVVVPREPTREMIDAGMMMASCELADEYRAMIEAATKG